MTTLDEFLTTLRPTTRITYRSAIQSYLTFVGMGAEEYIASGRNFTADIVGFLRSEKYAPNTMRTKVAAVIEWLRFAGVSFDDRALRQIRKAKPPQDAITKDEVLTTEVIRDVLQHADVRMRTAILTMVSTGMRVGELTQVEVSDYDPKNRSILIRGKYTKSRRTRQVYMTKEADSALRQWLKVRQERLELSIKRSPGRGTKTASDKRIFPYENLVIQSGLVRLLKKTGHYKEDNGRSTITPHSIRKYFSSRATLPYEVKEELMGHTTGLSRAYRRYTDEQIRDEYRKAELSLTIDVPVEMIARDVGALQKENEQLRKELSDIKTWKDEMTRKVLSFESLTQEWKQR